MEGPTGGPAGPEVPSAPDPPEGATRSGRRSVAWGVALTVLLHALQLPLAVAAALVACGLTSAGDDQYCGVFGLGAPLFIGVTQLVYMAPAVLIARRWGRTGLAQGLIIGAAGTFLLNAACWGVLSLGSLG